MAFVHVPADRSMSAGRILVVEDDPAVRRSTARALRLDRFEVLEAPDGRNALELLTVQGVDAILVDVMMPELDGLELCRRLRSAGDATPVLMVTARDTVDDRVDGLDAGADDYLIKPFALRELLARVRALLRRAANGAEADSQLSFADLTMDLAGYTVRRGARPVALTRTEFSLLALLLRHPRQVLTRSAIFEHIWGYDLGATSNSLGVYVGYLRRKTEEAGEPRLIHTVRGVGYVLREG